VSEEQSGQERSEQPTSKRLDESRKKGQVARSRELNMLLVMLASVLFLWSLGDRMIKSGGELIIYALSPSGELINNTRLLPSHLASVISEAGILVMPFLAVTVVAALAGPAIMGGLLFSPQAIAFKLEKLDPVKGLSRVFSTKGLIELVKALLKFLLISIVAILLFLSMESEVMRLVSLSAKDAIVRSGEMIMWSVLLLSMTLVLIAAIDVPYQLWSHNKQLKMTKQEVRDESKETDGRPEVKARIRQLQREASQRRMLEDVPQADVVITNPTHYSVALKYDPDGAAAPIVVAKGADLIALKIRTIALEHEVPVYEEPPLARAIFGSTDIGDEIPTPLFLAVARVLAYVFQVSRASATDYVPRPQASPLPKEFDKFNSEDPLNGF
jgi:flagellar biosynthetic protein FlhB